MSRTIPMQESLHVEFKGDRAKLSDRDLVLAVICLANSEGGDLYLGVEDSGAVTGLHADHLFAPKLASLVASRTVPSLDVRVTVFTEAGQSIARIEVPRQKAVIASSDVQMQRRRLEHDGTPECVGMTSADVLSRFSDLGQMDFSARPVAGATLADLDPEERARLRAMHERLRGDTSLRDLSDDELDGALGFVHGDGPARLPTITGLLLLGTERALRAHLVTHEVLFQVLEGEDVRVNDSYRTPLLRVFERIEAQLVLRNEEHETQVGLFRVPTAASSREHEPRSAARRSPPPSLGR